MKDFAKMFYKSKAWRQCRDSYIKSVGGLCQECLRAGLIEPGLIVHHKIELTPENISDPSIALNHDNLMYLCQRHHNEIHGGAKEFKRYAVDPTGRVRII